MCPLPYLLCIRDVQRAHRSRIARRARELREHFYAILAAAHCGNTVPKTSLDAIASEVRRAHAAQLLVATARSNAVGTAGSRFPRRKFRCTPARSQSKPCLSRPIAVASGSAAHQTARCISSIQARRIDGSGAACRTAAIAKNNGVGVRRRIEYVGRGSRRRNPRKGGLRQRAARSRDLFADPPYGRKRQVVRRAKNGSTNATSSFAKRQPDASLPGPPCGVDAVAAGRTL
jgi:hypothetical protein